MLPEGSITPLRYEGWERSPLPWGKMRGKWGGTSPSSKGCFKRGLGLFELLRTLQNTKVIGMTQGYGELGSQQSGIETHRGDSEAINHFADSTRKPAQKPLGTPHFSPSFAHMPYYTSSIDSSQCVYPQVDSASFHTWPVSTHRKIAGLGRIKRKHMKLN